MFDELTEAKYLKRNERFQESRGKSRGVFRIQASIHDEDFCEYS